MSTHEMLIAEYGVTMSKEEAAKVLKISVYTVEAMLRRGDIKGRQPTRRWVIPTESIANYLINGPETKQQFKKVPKGAKLIV